MAMDTLLGSDTGKAGTETKIHCLSSRCPEGRGLFATSRTWTCPNSKRSGGFLIAGHSLLCRCQTESPSRERERRERPGGKVRDKAESCKLTRGWAWVLNSALKGRWCGRSILERARKTLRGRRGINFLERETIYWTSNWLGSRHFRGDPHLRGIGPALACAFLVAVLNPDAI